MRQLVTVNKVIAIHHRNQYPCKGGSPIDHSDLKFSDTFSNLSRINSLKNLYFLKLSTRTKYQKK